MVLATVTRSLGGPRPGWVGGPPTPPTARLCQPVHSGSTGVLRGGRGARGSQARRLRQETQPPAQGHAAGKWERPAWNPGRPAAEPARHLLRRRRLLRAGEVVWKAGGGAGWAPGWAQPLTGLVTPGWPSPLASLGLGSPPVRSR